MSRLTTLLEELASKGFSQAQVAEAVGITPQFLSEIKCGGRPVSDPIARRPDPLCEWQIDSH
jgi:transcriptional regulator with XRE-family HTH domain